MSTSSEKSHDESEQVIELQGVDQSNTHYIYAPKVKVVPSVNSSLKKSCHASNKLSSSDLINYNWAPEFYYGNVLAYHDSLSLLAYTIKHAAKNNSMVKVFHLLTTSRTLLKDFNSSIVDISFAQRLCSSAFDKSKKMSSAILAVLESSGIVRLYHIGINLEGGTLSSSPLLLLPPTSIVDGIDALVQQNGGKSISLIDEIRISTSDWLKSHAATVPISASSASISRLIWCLGEDVSMDACQMLAVSRQGQTTIYLIMDLVRSLPSEFSSDDDNSYDPWLTVTPNVSCSTGFVTKLSDNSEMTDCENCAISDLCFSITGNVIATAGLDGLCVFHEISRDSEMEEEEDETEKSMSTEVGSEKSHKFTTKRIFKWKPFDGEALSSINFLDNQLSDSEPQWQSVLTGADYNRKLKLWRCDRWECMYRIHFDALETSDPLPRLQLRLDSTGCFALLSDIKRSVLYALEFRKHAVPDDKEQDFESDSSLPGLGSISEFLLRDSCLSLCFLKPARCEKSKQDFAEISPQSYQRPVADKFYVCLEFAHVHPKHLKQSRLIFPIRLAQNTTNRSGSLSLMSSNESHKNREIFPPKDLAMLPGISSSFTQVSSDSSVTFRKSSGDLKNQLIHDNVVSIENVPSEEEISEEIENVNSSASDLLNTIKQLHLSPLPTVENGDHPVERKNDEAGRMSPSTPVSLSQRIDSVSASKSYENDWPEVLPLPASSSTSHTKVDANESPKASGLQGGSSGTQQHSELLTHMFNNLLQSHVNQSDSISKMEYNVKMLLARQSQMLQVQHEMQMQWPPSDPREIWRPLEEVTRAQIDRLDKTFDQRFLQLQSKVDHLAANVAVDQQRTVAFPDDMKDLLTRVNRQQQSEMVSSVVKDIYTQISLQIRDSLQGSVNSSLDRNIPKITEPIRREIMQQVQDRLAAAQQAMISHLTQVITAKEFGDNLGTRLSASMQQPLMNAYKSVVKNDLVPAIDLSFSKLAQDINQAFSRSLSEFENQFAEHVSQRVSVLIKEQTRLRDAQIAQDNENLYKRIDTLLQRHTERINAEMRSLQSENKAHEQLLAQMSRLESSVEAKLTQHQHDFTAQLAKLSRNVDPLLLTSPVVYSKDVSAVVPEDPHIVLQSLIQRALAEKQYNYAFSQALTSLHLPLVEFVCSQVPVEILSQSPCPLEPTVLLSLVQQLCTDLQSNTATKLGYIEEALLNLDTQSSVCRGNRGRDIFSKIDTKLQLCAESVTVATNNEMKNIIRRCRAHCRKAII